jgi:outer membrane protein OmpA-like peptidoglycan-associated protein
MVAVAGRRLSSWTKSTIAAFSALFFGSTAFAQSETRIPENGNGDGMDTHLFRPAVDSKGFFHVNGTDVLGANDISFGLILDYGRNLMRTNQELVPPPGDDALIANSFQGTFQFNYGIANRVVVGLNAPLILMTGEAVDGIGPTTGTYNTAELDAQKLSTLALHGKVRLLRVDQGLGLSALLQFGFPIADSPRDLGGEPGFWYWPHLLVEKHIGATRRFKIGLDLGYRGHTGENARFGSINGQPQLAEGEMEYGNLLTFGLGLSYRVFDALDLVGETYGTQLLADADSKQKLSQEFVGGIKLFIERNSYLMMGGGSRAYSTGFEAADVRMVLGFVFEPSIGDRDGDGYKDDQDACPDEPEDFDGFKDEDGCPDPDNDNDGILDVDDRCPNIPEDFDNDEDKDGCPEGQEGDRDGDGIMDSRDKCPDNPEDRDGFEDQDGCPELDNDKDGIPDKDDSCPLDAEDKDGFEDADGCPDPDNDKDQIPDARDKCPNEPETYNGTEDADGCPDKGKVIIDGNNIVILEKVQFKTGSAEILPESFPIIDAVASTLKGNAHFTAVEVAGHADERSSDEYNLKLTKERAAAVVNALRQRGIATARLVSQGYGEYCPVDEARNAAAWEKNRRVEFKIVRTADGTTGVPRGCDRARAKGVIPPPVQ